MAIVQNVAQVGLFVVTASVFMHLSARFWLDDVAFVRAAVAVVVLTAVGGLLVASGLPTVVALLALGVAAVITLQTVYETDVKKAALIFAVYMVITAIVGGVLNSLFRILGWI